MFSCRLSDFVNFHFSVCRKFLIPKIYAGWISIGKYIFYIDWLDYIVKLYDMYISFYSIKFYETYLSVDSHEWDFT